MEVPFLDLKAQYNSIKPEIDETIKKTDLGNLVKGAKVNIERSLKVGDRMEGHFVLGHVDGVATIKKIEKKGNINRTYLFLGLKMIAGFAFEKENPADSRISPYFDFNSSRVPESKARA